MSELSFATRTENLLKFYPSCEALGRKIGVTWHTVWKWKEGKSTPKVLAVLERFEGLEELHKLK